MDPGRDPTTGFFSGLIVKKVRMDPGLDPTAGFFRVDC